MSTTQSGDIPIDDPRAVLAAFLKEFQEFLQKTLDNQRTWFVDELHKPLLAAWSELQPSFDTAVTFLTEPVDPTAIDKRLADVGLTGQQLELKRSGFRRALGRFRATVTKPTPRRVFGRANIILGSL